MINNDILEVKYPQLFDMVIANYFLNVFPREKMLKILTHLTSFVKPGGYMVIGDFMLPKEGGTFATSHSRISTGTSRQRSTGLRRIMQSIPFTIILPFYNRSALTLMR